VGKGIEDIVELRYSGRKLIPDSYFTGFGAGSGMQMGGGEGHGILFPEILFITNDAWPLVRGTARGRGVPLLLMDRYSNGILYVLTIPDNFNDLYSLPEDVLNAIRSYVMADFPVRLDAPSGISLFAYDNNSFVVESFLDKEASVTANLPAGTAQLNNLSSGERLAPAPEPAHSDITFRPRAPGAKHARFSFSVKPHSFVVFRY
jgi:hypothetical protein